MAAPPLLPITMAQREDIQNPAGTVIEIDDLQLNFNQLVDPSDDESLSDFAVALKKELCRLRPDVPLVLATILIRDVAARIAADMRKEHAGPAVRAGCLRLTTKMSFTDAELEALEVLEESGQAPTDLGGELRRDQVAQSEGPLRRINLTEKQPTDFKAGRIDPADLPESSSVASAFDPVGGPDSAEDFNGMDVSFENPLGAKKTVNLQINASDPDCFNSLIDRLFDEGMPLANIKDVVAYLAQKMIPEFPEENLADLLVAAQARLDESVLASTGKGAMGFASGGESGFDSVRNRSLVMSPSSRRPN